MLANYLRVERCTENQSRWCGDHVTICLRSLSCFHNVLVLKVGRSVCVCGGGYFFLPTRHPIFSDANFIESTNSSGGLTVSVCLQILFITTDVLTQAIVCESEESD